MKGVEMKLVKWFLKSIVVYIFCFAITSLLLNIFLVIQRDVDIFNPECGLKIQTGCIKRFTVNGFTMKGKISSFVLRA